MARRMSMISKRRIAELKLDEAIVRGRLKREGVKQRLTIIRCGCGSSGCGGFLHNQAARFPS